MDQQFKSHLRTIKAAVMALAFAGTGHTALAQSEVIKLPPAKRITLPNGIRVILIEYPRVPMISVSAVFPGGGANDPKGKEGLAALMAGLMRKGAGDRSAPQIAEAIDFLGGSLGAGSGDESTNVSLNVLSRDIDAGLDLFTDIIRKPKFAQEELDRERQLVLARLETLRDDPRGVAARVAEEVAYGDHPYGAQSGIASVKSISRDEILANYKSLIVPNKLVLVAVGDFKAAALLAKLNSRFGDWPKSDMTITAIPMAKPTSRKFVLIDKPDATQTQVCWIRNAFPRLHPNYFPAIVTNTILGGGFTSRLVEEIRINRSLTYNIGSRFVTAPKGGTFGVSTFTKLETTRKIIDDTQMVLKKAAAGLTQAELTKVKGYLIGSFAISMQTPEALSAQIANAAFLGLPDNYLETYLPSIRKVNLADINRIAQTYFMPGEMSLVLVTSQKKVDSQLKGLGKFEVRSVDTIGK